MTVEEKRTLRSTKLKELYDWNELNGGREAMIKYTDLHSNEKDKEEHLAYEYLADKGLINYTIMGRNLYQAKITSYGIDEVENAM